MIKIALAGNPNSGKTTLFNALTGSNQFVGNWPGVTVEKKEGYVKGNKDIVLTDLPGIYSLSPYTLEEEVTRRYLLEETVDVIINIVDGSNIERNLYLSTQLMELGIPVIMAINMMDIVKKNGDAIDTKALSNKLGCHIIEISALKKEGIEDLVNQCQLLVNTKTLPHLPQMSIEVEKVIKTITQQLDHSIDEVKKRFYAIKLFERDPKLSLPQLHIEDMIQKVEEKLDDDSESIITNDRYSYIQTILEGVYTKHNKEALSMSDKIDHYVTNRYLALPIFAVVMFLVYYVSVSTVGTWATDFVNDNVFGEGMTLFSMSIPSIPMMLEHLFATIQLAPWLSDLILNGIVAGVGAVLGFVPQMLVLFFFLAFLEGCGYMARVAFIMDRLFRKFGLSGKSFIPMLIGTGCGVPGIMASRTIESDRDRKMTIMTTTFIPCSAKLPIIALISGALFGGAAWVAPSAYFIGIFAIICSGIILKKTKLFTGNPAPFVMELPSYHMPTMKNVIRSMWQRGWSFIKKAGTIILLSTIVIWFTSNYGFENGQLVLVEELSDQSILSVLGRSIAWIFAPLGFGNWQSTVATVTGLVAKENVVGTFGILFGYGEVAENGLEMWSTLAMTFTTASAYAFLVFNLLCAPCFAAIGAIKREMNNAKWTWFALIYQTLFAYIVAFCVYQLGTWALNGVFTIFTILATIALIGFIYLLVKPQSKRVELKTKTVS